LEGFQNNMDCRAAFVCGTLAPTRDGLADFYFFFAGPDNDAVQISVAALWQPDLTRYDGKGMVASEIFSGRR